MFKGGRIISPSLPKIYDLFVFSDNKYILMLLAKPNLKLIILLSTILDLCLD